MKGASFFETVWFVTEVSRLCVQGLQGYVLGGRVVEVFIYVLSGLTLVEGV